MAKTKDTAAFIEEEINVIAKRRIVVEVVDGGLYFVAYHNTEGETVRKAATTTAALHQTIDDVLGIEKRPRKPRTPRAPAAGAATG